MTRPIALADATYERLKRRKRPGESFTETVERLIRNQRRDPMSFVQNVPRSRRSAKRRLADVERDREASWEDA